MRLYQIHQFRQIDGTNRPPGASEDTKFLVWNNSTGVFDYTENPASLNSDTLDGLVKKGSDGSPGQVWKLDENNIPDWRDEVPDRYLDSAIRETGGNDAIFNVSNSDTVSLALGALAWEGSDFFDNRFESIIGNRQYTDNNYINNLETVTSSIDNLDINLRRVEDLLPDNFNPRTDEEIRDVSANMIQNGVGINWNYDDTNDSLTPTVVLTPFTTDNLSQGVTNLYYPVADQTKLAGISDGAEANVQSDWNQTDVNADDYIENKPITITTSQANDITANTVYRNVGHIPVSEKAAANGVATLDAGGRVPASQLPAGILTFRGTFGSASSTTGGDLPVSGVSTGDVYLCDTNNYASTVAGITFNIGDEAIRTSTGWTKVDNTDQVTSVQGATGAIQLDISRSGDIVSMTGSTTTVDLSDFAKTSELPPVYVLPIATNSVLGGVKIGSNVSVSADGTISVAAQVNADWTETDPTDISYIQNKPTTFNPIFHSSTHELNGSDQINVTGLLGVLQDFQKVNTDNTISGNGTSTNPLSVVASQHTHTLQQISDAGATTTLSLTVGGLASTGVVSGANATDDSHFVNRGYADGRYLRSIPIATNSILGGIMVGSGLSITPDGVLSVNALGGVTSVAGKTGAVTLVSTDITDFVEASQDAIGSMVDGNTETGISVTYNDSTNKLNFIVDSQTDNNFTDVLLAKLNGIESGATGDQTASEIKTLYESNANTNAYTTDEKNKLAGIAIGAEVNVQSDWNQSDVNLDDYIRNKPTTITQAQADAITENTSYRNIGHIPLSQKGANDGVATLNSSGKIPASQLPSGILTFRGTFGSSSSTTGGDLPATASTGDLYICDTNNFASSVAGATFNIGDQAIRNASGNWDKIDNTDAVTSVQGSTGAVQLNITRSGDIISMTGSQSTVDLSDFAKSIDVPSQYVLPIATSNTLGGVMIGNNINIDANGVISADDPVTPDWNQNNPNEASYIANKPSSFNPSSHNSTHQNGGVDQINVNGLLGVLQDFQKTNTDSSISGDGTTSSPLSVVSTGHSHTLQQITDEGATTTASISVGGLTSTGAVSGPNATADSHFVNQGFGDSRYALKAGSLTQDFSAEDITATNGLFSGVVTCSDATGNTHALNRRTGDARYLRTIPIASSLVLGGIKIGQGLSIAADGTVSVSSTGFVTSVAGRTGVVTLTSSDIIDFTGSAQDAIGDTVVGNTETGISVTYDNLTNKLNFVVDSQTDNNFTDALLAKLNGIASGAEVNVNADWNATSGDAQILNKPNSFIPSLHATTHELNGSDAINVGGLSGVLQDFQKVNTDTTISGDGTLANPLSVVASQHVHTLQQITDAGNTTTQPIISTSTISAANPTEDAHVINRLTGDGRYALKAGDINQNFSANTLIANGGMFMGQLQSRASFQVLTSDSHIQLHNTAESKIWTIEVTDSSYKIIESGFGTRLAIAPGGAATFSGTVSVANATEGTHALNRATADARYLQSIPIATDSVLGNVKAGDRITIATDGAISADVQSDNNFTTTLLNKLNGIAEGAEVNVNADWNSISGDSQILNKPTLAAVATSGDHMNLLNIGTNSHAQIDTHIATQNIHIDWTNTNQNILTTGTLTTGTGVINGNLNVTGTITYSGDVVLQPTQELLVADNIIGVNNGQVGSGVSRTFAGLRVDRGDLNPYMFVFNENTDSLRIGEFEIEGNVNIVSTTSTTIVLPSSASSVDDFYNGRSIRLFKSGETGLQGNITDYVGSTRTATVDFNPSSADNTWSYEILIQDSTQAVATRQDNPIANGLAFWNDTENRFDTITGITRDGNNIISQGNISGVQGIFSSTVSGANATADSHFTNRGYADGRYAALAGSLTQNFSANILTANAFRTAATSTDFSLITRDSNNPALYVQKLSNNVTDIVADFRIGAVNAGGGVSVFRILGDRATINNNIIYHAGNSNLPTVDWTAQNLFATQSIRVGSRSVANIDANINLYEATNQGFRLIYKGASDNSFAIQRVPVAGGAPIDVLTLQRGENAATFSGTVSGANATADNHFLNRGYADLRYAAIAGNSSQDFATNALTATTGTFSGNVIGATPTLDSHLATKAYVDAQSGGGTVGTLDQVLNQGNISTREIEVGTIRSSGTIRSKTSDNGLSGQIVAWNTTQPVAGQTDRKICFTGVFDQGGVGLTAGAIEIGQEDEWIGINTRDSFLGFWVRNNDNFVRRMRLTAAGNLEVDGRISSSLSPVNDGDVVTKGYADINYTANINIANQGTQLSTSATALNFVGNGVVASGTGSTKQISITQRSDESIQDVIGEMVSGNTETGISVSYNDSDGKLDFAVDSQTDNNYTTAEKNKLAGVQVGAQVNPTNVSELTNDSNYIADAPSDGNTYGRNNGAWVQSGGSTGGLVFVGTAQGSSPDVGNVNFIPMYNNGLDSSPGVITFPNNTKNYLVELEIELYSSVNSENSGVLIDGYISLGAGSVAKTFRLEPNIETIGQIMNVGGHYGKVNFVVTNIGSGLGMSVVLSQVGNTTSYANDGMTIKITELN